MKKVIGLVCEGPTDMILLRSIIDFISEEKNEYRYLQPEVDMTGRYGNGWKGVWKWCSDHSSTDLLEIMDSITPKIDAVIIQMDGDVSRKEKEPHCICKCTECEHKSEIPSVLLCPLPKVHKCPIVLPCSDHESGPSGYRMHLKHLIQTILKSEKDEPRIIITIPCDSTEAWIVSAYRDSNDPENDIDPWDSIISLQKTYHGIRVRKQKSQKLFHEFTVQVQKEWYHVVDTCVSAKCFDDSIRRLFA